MKRVRLSTLMLLIVIATLSLALAVQQSRFARREAELKAKLDSRGEAAERLMQMVKRLKSQQSNVGKPSVKAGDNQ